MSVISWLESPFISIGVLIAFEELINVIIKQSILLGGGLLIIHGMQRISASIRHWILVLVFSGVALIPLISVLAPVWELALWPSLSTSLQEVQFTEHARSSTDVVEMSNQGINIFNNISSWPLGLLLIWISGIVLGAIRVFIGMRRQRYLRQNMIEWEASETLDKLNQWINQSGIQRPIQIKTSKQVLLPFTWGIRRPSIALPGDAVRWSEEDLKMVILHELAHIYRYDVLTTGLAQVLAILFWFNPLIRIGVKQLISLREQSGDNEVLETGIRPSRYAQVLLEATRRVALTQRGTAWGVGIATRTSLENRLLSVLDPNLSRQHLRGKRKVGLTVILVGLVMAISSIQAWERGDLSPEKRWQEMMSVESCFQQYVHSLVQMDATGIVDCYHPDYIHFKGLDYKTWARGYAIKIDYNYFRGNVSMTAQYTMHMLKRSGTDYIAIIDIKCEGVQADGTCHQIDVADRWLVRMKQIEDTWKIQDIYKRSEQEKERYKSHSS